MVRRLKKYPISQYYFANISSVSVYEKHSIEAGFNLLFHHINENFTLLLERDGQFIDLINPTREILMQREGGEDCHVIHWKHSLEEYALDYINMPDNMNSIQALCFFFKNQDLLKEQSNILESKDACIRERERKLV